MGVRRRVLVVPVLAALVALPAGCADGGPAASGPSSDPGTGTTEPSGSTGPSDGTSPSDGTDPSGGTGSSGSAPAPKSPPPAGEEPPAAEVALTGTTVAGVESGCTLLVAGGTAHLLVGLPAPVEPGVELTVRGAPDPELVTTCQEGEPFVVTEVVAS